MTATLTKTLGSLDDFRGTLCVPGDPDYPRVRAIWNGQVAREPALIATCHDACDVRTVLRRAVDAGMVTAVRGGGHNVAGTALCDGGVVIDLSAMRAVSLDPATGRVWVQGGATLADLDHATVPFARVAPAGIVTTTGVGGLTLGGGVGWTTRRFGLSCDNLVAVRLVTAAGDYLSVDDERDPELMWGLRGGGGNFGIVTEFEFATHPFGPVAVAGFVVYRLDDGPAVLRGYRQFAAAAPEEVTTIVVLRHAPPAPWIPVDQRGKPVVMIGAVHTGSIQTGIEALRPVKSLARPVADTVWPTPFLAHQAVLDASNPAGHRYYWKSDHLAELNDEAIDLLVEQTAQLSSPDSLIGIFQLGGAAARGGERSCFPSRHARFMVNYATHWTEAREDDLHRQWTRDAIEALAPYGLGTAYVNFTADDAPMHVETLYSTTEFSRLVTLKNRLDPDNVSTSAPRHEGAQVDRRKDDHGPLFKPRRSRTTPGRAGFVDRSRQLLLADAVRPLGRAGAAQPRAGLDRRLRGGRRRSTRTGHGAGVQRCRHRRGRPPRCDAADHPAVAGGLVDRARSERGAVDLHRRDAGGAGSCDHHLLHRRPRLGPSGGHGPGRRTPGAPGRSGPTGGGRTGSRPASAGPVRTRRRPSGGSHAHSAARRPYRTETAVSCVWLSRSIILAA